MLNQFVKSDFVKNAALLFSSSGLAQLIGLILVPILSRIYSPEEHGIITTFLSFISIGAAITTLKYEQAIVVEDNRDKARQLVILATGLNFIFLLISLALLFIFQHWVSGIFHLSSFQPWLVLIPVTIFISGLVEILSVWWNRERKYRKLSSSKLANAGLGALYKVFHKGLHIFTENGLVIGHITGLFINLLLLKPRHISKHLAIKMADIKQAIHKYRSFPLWAMPGSLINMIGTNLPIFIIAYYLGSEATGNFGNAIKLTYIPLGAISYAVGQVFYERLARLKTDHERLKLSKNILKFLFFLSLAPVLVLAVWGDQITPIILGKNWALSGQMVQIMVLFYFVMYISSPFAAAFEVYNALKLQFVYTSVFTITTGLALYLALSYSQNILFALIAFSVTGVLVRLIMMAHCLHLIGKNGLPLILKGSLLTLLALIFLATLRYIWG